MKRILEGKAKRYGELDRMEGEGLDQHFVTRYNKIKREVLH